MGRVPLNLLQHLRGRNSLLRVKDRGVTSSERRETLGQAAPLALSALAVTRAAELPIFGGTGAGILILAQSEPVDTAAGKMEEGSAAPLVGCTVRVVVAAVQPGASLLGRLKATLVCPRHGFASS